MYVKGFWRWWTKRGGGIDKFVVLISLCYSNVCGCRIVGLFATFQEKEISSQVAAAVDDDDGLNVLDVWYDGDDESSLTQFICISLSP